MSDLKWGFEKEYAHKSNPSPWSSAGYSSYKDAPLVKKSFRHPHLPAFRDDMRPLNTDYTERSQDESMPMSSYGCHKEHDWNSLLRSPRNPFPGRHTREASYSREPSPAPSFFGSASPCSSSRASSSCRKEYRPPMVPEFKDRRCARRPFSTPRGRNDVVSLPAVK